MISKRHRLQFENPEIERGFRAFYRQRSLVASRMMTLVAAGLYGGFVIFDFIFAPQAIGVTIPVRAIGCAAFLLSLALSYDHGREWLSRVVFQAALVYVILTLEYFIVTLPTDQALLYLPSVMVVHGFMIGSGVFSYREMWGLSAVLVLSFMLLPLFIAPALLPLFVAVAIYLLGFVIISGIASYKNEQAIRADFLTQRRLADERNLSRELAERERAASRAKSDFLAHMSHELRTPLNAILAYSEIIRDEHLGIAGSGRYREYAGDIHASGVHLLTLIEDLLDMSRIEAGKYELNEAAIRADRIVEDALTVVQPLIDKKGLTVTVDRPVQPVQVLADPRSMMQILVNVLSNAIKFTPPGGRIDCLVSAESDAVSFSIHDTGVGMPKDKIPVAMEPFGQIENPMRATVSGTGLGLPIVKALVDLHGGELHIDSELGAGTTVTITLPPARRILEPAIAAAG